MKIESFTVDTTNRISDLCKIAMPFNSDKCPYSKNTNSGHNHPYTAIYDKLLSHLKNEPINFAEIGIEKNDSIKIWRKYFSLAKIYGFDIDNSYILAAKNENINNVDYEEMDVKCNNSIKKAFKKINVKYDILIDDSSHVFNDQIRIIKNSVEYLNKHGILIIEDIFRSRDEEDYKKKLDEVNQYFSVVMFITTEHENRYSGTWNNDKLLILFRNDVCFFPFSYK